MTKLTKAQRQALTNARDFGNAWNHSEGHSTPWTAGKDRMHKALWNAGLLNGSKITEAGIAALA